MPIPENNINNYNLFEALYQIIKYFDVTNAKLVPDYSTIMPE